MIIYSEKILQFIYEIKSAVKDILSKEVRLKLMGDRFYNQRQDASYPIKVVIYNNKSMLGYFDSDFYEIGFNACLMYTSRQQLHNVIRHELAHYLSFIKYGQTTEPHGSEFRSCCHELGWGEQVYRATFCLEEEQIAPMGESSVLRKVQKLMALATSSNKNEAEQAMIKSQQLLQKHNLESKYIGGDEDEEVVLKRIMKQKREDAKMRAIGRILETFFVTIVYNRAGDFTYLEILGSAVNVEIAEYVAGVLQCEMDKFWNQAQKQANLKGMVAKNSFFLGLAKGYCSKIDALKKDYSSDMTKALMILEKKLCEAKAMVYQRLSSVKRSGSYCHESSALGERMGRQLTLNPALKKPLNTAVQITYSS